MKTILWILWRLWSVVVGVVMISLSLFFQALVFMLLALAVIPKAAPQLDPRISFCALIFLFNGVSCYEYFWKRKVVTLDSKLHGFKAIAERDSGHYSMAVFLVPRGIDRILTGRELSR